MLYDISVALHPDLPGFPQDPSIEISDWRSDSPLFHVSRLACGSHAGTHLDMAGHVGLWGAQAAEQPLDLLIGPCRVADLSQVSGAIDAAILQTLPLGGCRRLLLKTRNSRLWRHKVFCRDFQALSLDGARYLADCGVDLVGIDYLSIEAYDGEGEVHRRLLRDGGAVLEGLDLSAVAAGTYELICLPLKLACADGTPCRAVLRGPQ